VCRKRLTDRVESINDRAISVKNYKSLTIAIHGIQDQFDSTLEACSIAIVTPKKHRVSNKFLPQLGVIPTLM
jgi:hypothetical protein